LKAGFRKLNPAYSRAAGYVGGRYLHGLVCVGHLADFNTYEALKTGQPGNRVFRGSVL
jgi:hypothetical protein